MVNLLPASVTNAASFLARLSPRTAAPNVVCFSLRSTPEGGAPDGKDPQRLHWTELELLGGDLGAVGIRFVKGF